MKRAFQAILDDIANGGLAGWFQAECDSGGVTLDLIGAILDGEDLQFRAEDRVL